MKRMVAVSHVAIIIIIFLRILVQSGIHDEFVDGLRRSIEGLKQGGPFEDGVNVGPLIHEAAVDKVQ